MATLSTNKVQKSSEKYNCEICDYTTSRQCQYIRHLETTKHKKRILSTNINENDKKSSASYKCEVCNKYYKERTGLWKHKKKGCFVNNDTEHDVKYINNNASDKDELINYLIKENQEFKSMIIEFVKKDSYNQCTTNNNNNNNNNNNYNKIA